MKIAIIDDEIYWRDYTYKIVSKYYGTTGIYIDIFESGEKYLKSRECYDISFIDIEMPKIDGFDTIIKAREYNRDGIFVILTTHVEMSRRGYLVNAFRYIDKMNIEKELVEAMKSSEVLLGRNEKIFVNIVRAGRQELILKNIIYFETDNHAILVHTTHGIIKSSDCLADMENILNGKWFFRCHNAYIVNLDEVIKIEGSIVIMSNGNRIEVSRRRILEFKRLYLQRQYKCANG